MALHRNGQIIVAFVETSQEAIPKGPNLADGQWHWVHVNVTSVGINVSVDTSLYFVERNVPNLESFLYLGSPLDSYTKMGFISSHTFSGCVRKVQLNGQSITFDEGSSILGKMAPKSGCRKDVHCKPNPCSNNGQCVATWVGFTCRCLDDFGGKTCDNGMCFSQNYPYLISR